MRCGSIRAGAIVVLSGQDLAESRFQDSNHTSELSLSLSDPPAENECGSPSPNSRQRQRDMCTAATADVRVEMRYGNVSTFNLCTVYTRARARHEHRELSSKHGRQMAMTDSSRSLSVMEGVLTPSKGLVCANATFTHDYSALRPQLNTDKELCGGPGSACVNTAAPRATFRCDSQFLCALSASRLPAPLGIASLMNANGKGLIQLKTMNNGGAW